MKTQCLKSNLLGQNNKTEYPEDPVSCSEFGAWNNGCKAVTLPEWDTNCTMHTDIYIRIRL